MNNSRSMILKRINGVIYKKSTASERNGQTCVGVALVKDNISVINTNSEGVAIEFTLSEWTAFLEGAKAGEFDLENLPRA